ncbi:hypothetical protein ACFSUJ_00605 [Streptomyces lusitanus]|uniref:KS-MAT linker domain-containing protein n=1 Tax=Streptomyces lusitanus TaxID=68232 RepID=UPI00363727E0
MVSARSADALRAQAERLLSHLTDSADTLPDPADVAHSLLTGRAALEERAVVVGGDTETLLAGLQALATGTTTPALARAPPSASARASTRCSCSRGRGRSGPGWRLNFSIPVRCSRSGSRSVVRRWPSSSTGR